MNLIFAQRRREAPSDPAVVNTTVTTVVADAPAAVEQTPPEFNAVPTDDVTEGGLTTRQLAAHVIPRQRPRPAVASPDYSARIDSQVSSAGTAAAREASGVWGHGTLQISESIEPTIVDGQQFGPEYFAANRRPVPPAGGMLTTAPDATEAARGGDAATGASRDAGGVYAAMWAGLAGGAR